MDFSSVFRRIVPVILVYAIAQTSPLATAATSNNPEIGIRNEALIVLIKEARDADLPVDILISKINEGIAKKVPDEKILASVRSEYQVLFKASALMKNAGVPPDKSSYTILSDLSKSMATERIAAMVSLSWEKKQDMNSLKRNLNLALLLKTWGMPEEQVTSIISTSANNPSMNNKKNLHLIAKYVQNAYSYGLEWEEIAEAITQSINSRECANLTELATRLSGERRHGPVTTKPVKQMSPRSVAPHDEDKDRMR